MRASKVLVLVFVGLASRQAVAGYQTQGTVSQAFSPITGNPINVGSGPGQSREQTLSLPFPFRFWGVTYNAVNVGYRGYLNFTGTAQSSYSYGIPSKTTPYAIVAPWWGYWEADPGSVTYLVTGSAPSRVLTFQWSRVYYVYDSKGKSANGATFQAKLHESTGRIEFAYGTSNHGSYTSSRSIKAGVGIQNETGTAGVAGLACTTDKSSGCTVDDFPANSAITFLTPSDLSPTRVYADEVGYAGVPMRMGAAVSNTGGDDARSVVVRFYLSTDGVLDSGDAVLGDARAIDLAVGQRRDVALTPLLPKALKSGTYFLFARVDPGNAITEDDENNNTGPAGGLPFSLGTPSPDLAVGAVTIPASAKAGTAITVSRTLQNIGNALVGSCSLAADCGGMACDQGRCRASCAQSSDCSGRQVCDVAKGICDVATCTVASDCPGNERCDQSACKPREVSYSLYLSDNAVISRADRLLTPAPGTTSVKKGIAAFDADVGTDPVTLPADLAPGDYFVGVILDPGNEVTEISEVNNAGASQKPITIVADNLSLVTKSVPDAAVQAPYSVRLRAAGGSGSHEFTVGGGALPAGLSLSRRGDLAGVPAIAGSFTFKVQVESAQTTASGDLTIKVLPSSVPLTILTTEIPAAEFGKPYSVRLSAVGGTAPYAWSLSSGLELPPGMVLAPDGTLEGLPGVDGIFAFQVELKDSAGASRAQPMTLTIASPDRMRIVTTSLADAWLGKPYSAILAAAGGKAPFRWEVVESRRIPVQPTDVGEPARIDPPAGLSLGVDKGIARLAGVPQMAGTYALTLRATDDLKKTDSATYSLIVRFDSGLRILTQGLPDALANKDYATQLVAEGAEGKVKWSLTCVATTNEKNEPQPCPRGLPPQFSLADDGTISTSEPVQPPEAEEGKQRPERTTYPFMVKAEDEKGRTAVQGLSITLRVDKPPPNKPLPQSCQSGSGGAVSFASLGVALLALSISRRRRT